MILETLVVGYLQTNCYIIGDRKKGEIAIIDPGGEAKKIIQFLNKNNFTPQFILHTHGHADHTRGDKEILDDFSIPVLLHEKEAEFLQIPIKECTAFKNLNGKLNISITPYVLLQEGDIINIGKHTIKVIFTPGHTPGGICFLMNQILFSGDTLFSDGIGRTDFEGGDYNTLIGSITNKLFILDEKIKVYPGHGPSTTIGNEKKNNLF